MPYILYMTLQTGFARLLLFSPIIIISLFLNFVNSISNVRALVLNLFDRGRRINKIYMCHIKEETQTFCTTPS